MKKPSILIIFLTVFIDLVGFGIVVPSLSIYGKHIVPECVQALWAQALVMGIIVAAFSAMQFVFSPIWGRLSDQYGRRPILLFSTAAAAASYVLFAISAGLENHLAGLWLLILSRAFAGACGGNITVAQAYIADITPPEKRSKGMGLIGMAFGLGFIFGPAIGGAGSKYLGATGPGWIAAALCAGNFLLALFILQESRQPSSRPVEQRPHLEQWLHTLKEPRIGGLVMVFFLSTFCFSCFETTLALVVSDNFHIDIRTNEAAAVSTASVLFVFCGLIGALVQGGLIGRLVEKMGEPKLIALSLVLTAVSMVALPFIGGHAPLSWGVLFRHEGLPWVVLLAALVVLSVGTSLTRPPLFGLLSNLTAAHEQGGTIGVAQGAGSLARILGPLFAMGLLPYSPPLPYLACALVLLGTTAFVVKRFGAARPTVKPGAVASAAP